MPKEKKQDKLEYDDIQRQVLEEVDQAEDNSENKSSGRQASWDRYYGRSLGNEVKGRSKFTPEKSWTPLNG